jgi:NTE family protein
LQRPKQLRLLLLGLVLAVFTQPAQAERPKIGLALSGGGAKGSAHIAVIELLEANNIPVDYVAGTSIGAYVGGLYALGHTAAEIKEIMYSADFQSGFSDAIDRAKLPFRDKRPYDKFNIKLEAGYRDGEIRLPGGVLYGQSMTAVYRQSVGNIASLTSFDDLAIPFRAVATDLATSEKVVLDHGDLVKAMKASATVPGVLVPVHLQGKFLVDGGMSENLPISQVRAMGADVVIAVDISSPLLAEDELKNALSVLGQLINFLTVQNLEAERKNLGDNDIYIRPGVDQLSTSDFSNLNTAYEAGKVAANQQLHSLRELSVGEDEYEQYQRLKRLKLIDLKRLGSAPIVEVILDNRSSFKDQYLLHKLGIDIGRPLSARQLLRAIDRIYSLNKFERVEASIEDREQGRVVIVEAVEKSWGPNQFLVGLSWEDDFTLDSAINIDFGYIIGNITDNNGEWRNELGIGTDKTFRSELYLPLNVNQNFYQITVYDYRRFDRNYFVDNERALVFEQTNHRFELGLGYSLENESAVEVGLLYEKGRIENDIFLSNVVNYHSPGVYIGYGYDTLDHISFPTRGNRFTVLAVHRDENLSGDVLLDGTNIDETFLSTRFLLDWKAALSSGNHGVIGIASFSYLESEVDGSIFVAELGGFLNLSGYHRNALVGDNKAFVAFAYQYNIGRGLFGLTSFPIYLGGSVETGNVWDASESISTSDLILANSIYLSTDSKLGPIALAYGNAEGDHQSIYFYLGKNF